jgi:hypothetical protein
MNRLFAHIMFPKAGWFILHALAIALLFLLGYCIKF